MYKDGSYIECTNISLDDSDDSALFIPSSKNTYDKKPMTSELSASSPVQSIQSNIDSILIKHIDISSDDSNDSLVFISSKDGKNDKKHTKFQNLNADETDESNNQNLSLKDYPDVKPCFVKLTKLNNKKREP